MWYGVPDRVYSQFGCVCSWCMCMQLVRVKLGLFSHVPFVWVRTRLHELSSKHTMLYHAAYCAYMPPSLALTYA